MIALWTGTCNSSTFLRADGSCQVPSSTGGTVNVSLQGSMPFYSAVGSANTISGVPPPTTPAGIAQTYVFVPGNTVGSWAIPGVPIDAQTGTSYTIPITDDVTFVTGNNASATAWTGFTLANNYAFSFENLGAGLITYTPASGTVNGNATQIIPQNWFGFHYTDNTNTRMPVMPTLPAFPNCPDTSGNHLNINTATGAITCGTTASGAGISGGTSGYAALFGSATTITSGIQLAGAGAGLTTGPVSVTSGDVPTFTGTGGQLSDALGIIAANLVTQSSNGTNGYLCTYTGSNKVCVPAQALPNGITATTQTATDTSALVTTDAFVSTAITNAIAAVNPAVAALAASTASLTGTYANGASGIGATFTVTATGAFTLDGVSISTIGQRVLLKNQSSAFQNGIYTATVVGTTGISPVFTRALDYDQPSDMNTTGAIPVQSGTVNAETSWLQTSTVNTVGTDAVTFTQFSVAPANLVTAVSPGVGLCHFAGSTQACTSSLIVAADITANTITGSQLASSLSLVTPLLGTPTSGVITNLTGTCTACTANSASNMTGGAANDIPYQTGAGASSFITPVNSAVLITSAGGVPSESTTLPSGLSATNLTLTTPALGTPSALVLTNATGLPVAGGGTGVATLTAYAPLFGGTTSTGAIQSGTAGTAGQVLVSGGASAKGSYIDFPERYFIPAANCNNATAGAGWSIPSGGTATCRAGTNNLGGYVAITDTSSTFAQFTLAIPFDWDTGTLPYIRFQLAYPGTDGSSSHTIIPQIKVACTTATSGVSDDPSFAAAHSSSTITLSSATANLFFSTSNVQMNSTDMSGCVAGGLMIVQVGRATDTATSAVNFYGADVTFPRLIAVQAN
jgi:hypothetical protein